MDEDVRWMVYDVLVEECAAPEDLRAEFMRLWPECGEFRFGGNLGFGGKVWWSPSPYKPPRIYVSGYPEDTGYGHEDRVTAIRRANARLEVISEHMKASNA